METKPREVFVYQNTAGKQPFKDWLLLLKNGEAKAAIARRIKNVIAGNFGDCERYGPITELRIDQGPGYRVYLGQKGQKVVVLLVGGDKSSQKKDFRIAERYWDDCEKRWQAALSSL